MRRAWAALVAVWATLAIVAVLAWSNRPPPTLAASPAQQTLVVVKGRHGHKRVVVARSNAAPVTMTHSSQAPR